MRRRLHDTIHDRHLDTSRFYHTSSHLDTPNPAHQVGYCGDSVSLDWSAHPSTRMPGAQRRITRSAVRCPRCFSDAAERLGYLGHLALHPQDACLASAALFQSQPLTVMTSLCVYVCKRGRETVGGWGHKPSQSFLTKIPIGSRMEGYARLSSTVPGIKTVTPHLHYTLR